MRAVEIFNDKLLIQGDKPIEMAAHIEDMLAR